jgi:hypothetical protein
MPLTASVQDNYTEGACILKDASFPMAQYDAQNISD